MKDPSRNKFLTAKSHVEQIQERPQGPSQVPKTRPHRVLEGKETSKEGLLRGSVLTEPAPGRNVRAGW